MKKNTSENSPLLILASASPRRRQLLKQAGLIFRVRTSGYAEGTPHGDPAQFARAAARAKALDVGQKLSSPAWVLAADTLVVQGRKIFGKPKTRTQAQRMLKLLSGREHQVVTGVFLYYTASGQKYSWAEKTTVRMRPINSSEIKTYLHSPEWKDKAGGYGIQGRAGAFVTRIEGCYFNVVGLPLGSVCAKLRKAGVS